MVIRHACLITFLAACMHDIVPSGEPGTVVDRGEFELFLEPAGRAGTERFAVVDHSDGTHVLLGELEGTKDGRQLRTRGRLVTDAAWRPIEGRFDWNGSTYVLARDGDALAIKVLSGKTGTRESAPSDLFDAIQLTVFLEPLCMEQVTARGTLALFPSGDIQVHANAATSSLPYTTVSVDGTFHLELMCEKHKLIVVNGGGTLIVRHGYERVGDEMMHALGPVR